MPFTEVPRGLGVSSAVRDTTGPQVQMTATLATTPLYFSGGARETVPAASARPPGQARQHAQEQWLCFLWARSPGGASAESASCTADKQASRQRRQLAASAPGCCCRQHVAGQLLGAMKRSRPAHRSAGAGKAGRLPVAVVSCGTQMAGL